MTTGGLPTLLAATQATEPCAWRLNLHGAARVDLTRQEAADLLGLTYEQVRHQIELGRLELVRRNTRIPLASILGFLGVTPQGALLGDYQRQPRLALTTAEAAGVLNANPTLLRRDLAASGLPTGWTGHMHVIPISTVLALAGAGTDSKAA